VSLFVAARLSQGSEVFAHRHASGLRLATLRLVVTLLVAAIQTLARARTRIIHMPAIAWAPLD
jgi:hypothetical protein